MRTLKGRSGGKWIDLGNGLRVQQPTKAAAAFHRQQQAERCATERQQQANTCGLGRWEEPEGWNRLAYLHTVTHVDANSAHWLPYVTGCTVALDVHPIEGPFTRGAAYVWCKCTRENGNVMFPTAPMFGRAYRTLQPILNAATAQSEQVVSGLADYLKASPSLAYWLKRWQG